MQSPFLPFQRFSDPGLADALAEKLEAYGIPVRIEKENALLDAVFIGQAAQTEYVVKIAAADFVKAYTCLEEYYSSEVEAADPSYYLFSFSDEELEEIITHPSEWGPFDYQLAKKILKDRGMTIPESRNSILSQENIQQLARQSSGSGLILIAVLFIAYIILSLVMMNITYRYNFPYSIFLVLMAGSHLAWSKRTLPDGSQVPVFPADDRRAGKAVFAAGILLLLVTVFLLLREQLGFSFDPFEFSF